jgi:hypothetical protein
MVYYRFIVGLGHMCGYLLLHLHHVLCFTSYSINMHNVFIVAQPLTRFTYIHAYNNRMVVKYTVKNIDT